MKTHMATPELVVLEAHNEELTEEYMVRETVLTVLEEQGFDRWGSLEIEVFTYRGQCLYFARPVKLLVPNILLRLLEIN